MATSEIVLASPDYCDLGKKGEYFAKLYGGTPEGQAVGSRLISLGSERQKLDDHSSFVGRVFDLAKSAGIDTERPIGLSVLRLCKSWLHRQRWERLMSYAFALPESPNILILPDSLETFDGVGTAISLSSSREQFPSVVDLPNCPGEREAFAIVQASCSTPDTKFYIARRRLEHFVAIPDVNRSPNPQKQV